MTNTKVSNLPVATEATTDDLLYLVDGATTSKQITFDNLQKSVAHNSLTGLNDGDNYEHLSSAQVSALHTQGTDQKLDDGGANEVTASQAKTAYTHSQDNTQAHTDYLLNSGADEAVGPLTITADNSSADTAYVPMVLYNTDETPPNANTVPIGTIYIQYTP